MLELVYPPEPARTLGTLKPKTAEEMLPVVDPRGVVLAQAPRSLCHSPERPLHPVVHLQILSRRGEFFLQKRSAAKKIYPLRWDTAVGGHVSYGEYISEALFREAGEELSFFDFNPIFVDSYIYESDVERELVCLFAAVGDFSLNPCNEEVSEGRWWTPSELEAEKTALTPLFRQEFTAYKDRLLALL